MTQLGLTLLAMSVVAAIGAALIWRLYSTFPLEEKDPSDDARSAPNDVQTPLMPFQEHGEEGAGMTESSIDGEGMAAPPPFIICSTMFENALAMKPDSRVARLNLSLLETIMNNP